MFSIDADKTITYSEDSTPGALNFSTQQALQTLADAQNWSREILEEIWNGFAGVVPFDDLKPVKKFRNRPYGVAQIWKVVQRLVPASPTVSVAVESPVVAPTDSKPARKVRAIKKATSEGHRGEKREAVLALIGSKSGASVQELMDAMGWLRHTVRGFISTLQSKHGVAVVSDKDAGRGHVYRIAKEQ